jgi:hypothetical protein
LGVIDSVINGVIFDVARCCVSFNGRKSGPLDSLGSYRFVSIFMTTSRRSNSRRCRAARQRDRRRIIFPRVRAQMFSISNLAPIDAA